LCRNNPRVEKEKRERKREEEEAGSKKVFQLTREKIRIEATTSGCDKTSEKRDKKWSITNYEDHKPFSLSLSCFFRVLSSSTMSNKTKEDELNLFVDNFLIAGMAHFNEQTQ
jgi:benzoyl-CoA reductase/2-hydroxyglutaryl-CoA dehydratase subunit BcrC/BadD/HgdB